MRLVSRSITITLRGSPCWIAAISIDEGNPQDVITFAQKLGLTFDILHDRDGVVQEQYQTTGVPESFLLDRRGILVKRVIGPEVARTLLPAAAPAVATAGEIPADTPGRDSPTMKMLELARVNGEVQQKSIEKIGELVKTNPAESVAVLRQWINDRN